MLSAKAGKKIRTKKRDGEAGYAVRYTGSRSRPMRTTYITARDRDVDPQTTTKLDAAGRACAKHSAPTTPHGPRGQPDKLHAAHAQLSETCRAMGIGQWEDSAGPAGG